MLDHSLGEHLACVVWRVFRQKPSQQIAAAGDSEADREAELVVEGSGFTWCSCSVLIRERQTPRMLSRPAIARQLVGRTELWCLPLRLSASAGAYRPPLNRRRTGELCGSGPRSPSSARPSCHT
jgi:hypothetical protein